ncbi:MAG: hypothetical protein ACOCZV_00750, partial [Nanoarchaeota archaeon]
MNNSFKVLFFVSLLVCSLFAFQSGLVSGADYWSDEVESGYQGDQMYGPSAVEFDSAGNLFVAGTLPGDGEFLLQKRDATGTVDWDDTFQRDSSDGWAKLSVDDNDNVYLVTSDRSGEDNVLFVKKYSSSGEPIAEEQFEFSSTYNNNNEIMVVDAVYVN